MGFVFQPLRLVDIILVKPDCFQDDRGFFLEAFKSSLFAAHGIPNAFVQDNHSCSAKHTLRGLHYQLPPFGQGKLVRVVKGSVFDVAVDIREGSPTYGQWAGEVLSECNHHQLWVPPGFAHGFVALEDDTHLVYKVTEEYSASHDRNIRWDDPGIAINWPVDMPYLSDKDRVAPLLSRAENTFLYQAEVGV
jgi:dTDP-4-dehydrorhamnose 3,5-epimerase